MSEKAVAHIARIRYSSYRKFVAPQASGAFLKGSTVEKNSIRRQLTETDRKIPGGRSGAHASRAEC